MSEPTPLTDRKAERAVLGSIIIDPEAIWSVGPTLEPSDFYFDEHMYIFEAMQAIAARGGPVDFVTLIAELKTIGTIDHVGGDWMVADLYKAVPSAISVMSYAGIVADMSVRRKMDKTAEQWRVMIHNQTDDVDDIITWATTRLQSHGRGGDIVPAKSVVDELHAEFTQYVDAPLEPGEVRGIDTGWRDVNGYLGGWKPGFYVVLGEPHVGKSWFVLEGAMNVAKQGKRALLFSLEMKAIQLVRRLCLAHAGITQHNYDLGRVTAEQIDKFMEMEAVVAKWNLDIADNMSKASSIFSTIHREMRGPNPPSFIAIDYLGLIETNYNRESTNWEMIALTRALKNMARQLQVPIVTPHQISDKTISNRSDKRPKMSDGYGSGGISQDADVVLGLYRSEMHDNENPHTLEVSLLKDRLGGAANPNKPVMLIFSETGGLRDAARKEQYEHYSDV